MDISKDQLKKIAKNLHAALKENNEIKHSALLEITAHTLGYPNFDTLSAAFGKEETKLLIEDEGQLKPTKETEEQLEKLRSAFSNSTRRNIITVTQSIDGDSNFEESIRKHLDFSEGEYGKYFNGNSADLTEELKNSTPEKPFIVDLTTIDDLELRAKVASLLLEAHAKSSEAKVNKKNTNFKKITTINVPIYSRIDKDESIKVTKGEHNTRTFKEFSEAIESLKNQGCNLIEIKAPTGQGKTEMLRQYFGANGSYLGAGDEVDGLENIENVLRQTSRKELVINVYFEPDKSEYMSVLNKPGLNYYVLVSHETKAIEITGYKTL